MTENSGVTLDAAEKMYNELKAKLNTFQDVQCHISSIILDIDRLTENIISVDKYSSDTKFNLQKISNRKLLKYLEEYKTDITLDYTSIKLNRETLEKDTNDALKLFRNLCPHTERRNESDGDYHKPRYYYWCARCCKSL